MSRKSRLLRNRSELVKATSQPSSNRPLTLEDVSLLQQKLEIEKNLLIEKGLSSSDPLTILNTQRYLQQGQGSGDNFIKSFLFNPDIDSLNTNNFRTPTKSISYETLKQMARTPIIRTIIGTRVDQVANFAEPTDNEQEKGWKVRKKRRVSIQEQKEPTTQELKKIEYITNFIQNGGKAENKWDFESLEEYIRQLAYDSLSIDQMCMELANNRGGELCQFYPVDGSTIRLVDSGKSEVLQKTYPKKNGYFPKYVQVWQDQICTAYYPWEMTFGVRNKFTDINTNGYGVSELEDMITIVTWMLFGMQYNGNFFTQGSNPKGFFTLEGSSISPSTLNEFKQMWRNTVAGVSNSHKVPVMGMGNAKVNWVDMQTSNKDMEFDAWLEFLIVIGCSMFKIDPTECGFNLQKASQVFGQDGQKARLKHSQTKGLTPILKLIQRVFTKYIVERLDDDYEFVFCGVETEDQVQALDMDVKKIASGLMSLEDGFRKNSGRDFDPQKDTILNPVYLQIQQMKMMGGSAFGQPSGVEEENPNPFTPKEDMEESPFSKSLANYIENIGKITE